MKKSAGLLMYRFRDGRLEVLLVHPGGPFWQKKDRGAWSIPKGEYGEAEDPFVAACREFFEETGFRVEGNFKALGTLRQASGKKITAWAFEGDCDAVAMRSNLFSLEWPPHSGKRVELPEVDRAEWFPVEEAKNRIQKGQLGFIDKLCDMVAV